MACLSPRSLAPCQSNSCWPVLPSIRYYDSELCDLVRVPTRVQLKGVAVVSLVDIRRDEEILYDYAIGPPNCWPAWFHPVDPQYLERAVQIARAKRGHTCVPE